MSTINDSIKILHTHLMTRNVKLLSEGVQSLNNFFNTETLIWSSEKEEWNKMNRKQKSQLVKSLLKNKLFND